MPAVDEAFDGALDEAAGAEVFATLDKLEARLATRRYLAGARVTEADWRLFTTLVRFDAVYFGHFKCNVRRIVDYPNLSGYNASKFGLMGFSEATMLELRHANIKVIAICPGSTATDFGAGRDPVGRLTVEDVAHAILGALTASPNALQSQIHLRPLHPPKR